MLKYLMIAFWPAIHHSHLFTFMLLDKGQLSEAQNMLYSVELNIYTPCLLTTHLIKYFSLVTPPLEKLVCILSFLLASSCVQ